MQFLTTVLRFFTNIIAVFRFCRLLRFAEMDVFLTRFSDLSYFYSGFSVFEKYAVCGNSPPYCVSRFAGIGILIVALGLLVFPSLSRLALCSKRLMLLVLDIFLHVRLISFNIRLLLLLRLFLPFVHSKWTKSKSFNVQSMVPYFLLHLTSRVYGSCERETLQGKMLIKT